MTDNDAFLAAVVAAPADAAPKLIYSDFLDDAGEERLAKAYRWTVEHGKFPVPSLTTPSWFLWRGRLPDLFPLAGWMSEEPELLPAGLWQALPNAEGLGAGFKRYPSFDAAMRSLASALESGPVDESKWEELVYRMGGGMPLEGNHFLRLATAYGQRHRHYHTLAHVADCLRVFEDFRKLAKRPDEVEAALWYHDSVYDSQAQDNETRSAEWAVGAYTSCGVDRQAISRIFRLIMATKHDGPPQTPDEALIVDIDLSILGRDPETFAAYDRAIAQEYAWVPPDQYREGRAKLLQGFLDRRTIYHLPVFRERFEAQARENLSRAIAELRSKQA